MTRDYAHIVSYSELITDYLTTEEAAEQADVHQQSIRYWCKQYGVGRKVGGRWRVSPRALRRLLRGEIHPAVYGPRPGKLRGRKERA